MMMMVVVVPVVIFVFNESEKHTTTDVNDLMSFFACRVYFTTNITSTSQMPFPQRYLDKNRLE